MDPANTPPTGTWPDPSGRPPNRQPPAGSAWRSWDDLLRDIAQITADARALTEEHGLQRCACEHGFIESGCMIHGHLLGYYSSRRTPE